MSHLEIRDLGFAHSDAFPLFGALSLRLERGFTALVGENGSGKTTLLELIAGERDPDAGSIRIEPPDAKLCFVRQRIEAASAALRDFAGETSGEALRLRDTLGLDAAQLERWPTLSPGERMRWQIGAALAQAPDVLLLDEPTNHLDAEGRELLIDALGRFDGIALLVSHDRALLERLTTRTLRLTPGGAVADFPGAYQSAQREWQRLSAERLRERELGARKLRLETARAALAQRQRQSAERSRSSRARMKSPKDRDARSVGEKFRAARAESALARQVSRERTRVERARDALDTLEVEKSLGRSLFVAYERPRKSVLTRLDAAEVRAGEAPLLSDVHLYVERDARIRVAGGNGAGKTTLLRRLLDEARLPPDRVLYLPQHTTRAVEHGWLSELGSLGRDARGRACSLLAALGTDPNRVLDSREPSPGEARKIALATALGRHAWLLVLDEPTNHLDLPCVERLEEALERFPGAIVLVSHDDAFAKRLTRVTWTLRGGRVEVA